MNEDIAVALFGMMLFGGVFVFLFVVMGMALYWQRKGLAGQQKALSSVEESMSLSRRALETQEQMLALLEEAVRQQREILQLQRRQVERGESIRPAGSS